MAAHPLAIAAQLARYDAAPHTPPNLLAAWLRTPPTTRWAALDVLSAAGATTTLGRLDALMAHVVDTERAVDDWTQEWTTATLDLLLTVTAADVGPDDDPGAPFTEPAHGR